MPQTPGNQVQQSIYGKAVVQEADHLFDAEPCLLSRRLPTFRSRLRVKDCP